MGNALLILDECAVSKDLKIRSNNFISLGFSGRHDGISVWVLTQQLTSISKPFRENVACIIVFNNPSQVGTKTLFEEYRIFRICFNLRHPFDIYLEIPNKQFKNNKHIYLKMSNIVEQIIGQDEHTPSPETLIKEKELEIKREQLAILAMTGTTKEFLGDEMTLKDVYDLSNEDVNKYHLRYNTVMGKINPVI